MVEVFALAVSCGAILAQIPRSISASIMAIIFVVLTLSFRSVRGTACAFCIVLSLLLGVYLFTLMPEPTLQPTNEITGTVSAVDRRLDKSILVIDSGDMHVQAAVSDMSILPNDTVTVHGAFVPPKDFVTDSGRLFEYHDYMASRGIELVAVHATLRSLTRGPISFARIAAQIRFSIADCLSRYVSFPMDGIISGMLVGYQGNIPLDITNLFRTTGVLHTLVLSGSNVSLLAIFLSVLLRPLPFKMRTVLIILAISALVLVSGAGVSAIRAGIMGTIALASGLVRRGYIPVRALSISYLFFLICYPRTVFADPGFQLSFLATTFIILVIPKAQQWLHRIPERFNLRELVLLAVGLPLFMLPYTMYFSGFISPAFPLANVLLDIAVPIFMAGGTLILALSWMSALAGFFGVLMSLLGAGTLAVLRLLNTLPHVNTPPLPWWGVGLIYSVFMIALYRTEIMLFVSQLRTSLLPRSN